MGILLLANTVMQGHWAWYVSWSFDAQCLFDDLGGNWGGKPGYWAEVNIVLIVVFYPMQILLLFKSTSKVIDEWLWMRPRDFMANAARTSNELGSSSRFFLIRLGYQCLGYILDMARAVFTFVAALLGSRTISFALDVFWFAYGCWSLMSDRALADKNMDGSENSLTFGQIMPLLLLISTVFVLKEIYEGETPEFQTLQPVANAYNR